MDKLSKRTISRIQAMKILYMADVEEISIIDALKKANSGVLDNDEINENKEITSDAMELVVYVDSNLDKIDSIISDSLVNYTIGRLNKVDKAIIRIAVAEMIKNEVVSKNIIINEALEITKLYSDTGDHKAVAFNNRLLDNISKKI